MKWKEAVLFCSEVIYRHSCGLVEEIHLNIREDSRSFSKITILNLPCTKQEYYRLKCDFHAGTNPCNSKKKTSLVVTRLFAALPYAVHSCGWHGVVAAGLNSERSDTVTPL